MEKDSRRIWRDVAKLCHRANAFLNLTALVEGKKRAIGFLEVQGDQSRLVFRGDLAGGMKATSTTITSSKDPADWGDQIQFTVTISDPSATGTVQFKIDGQNFGPAVAVQQVVVNGKLTAQAVSQFISSLTPTRDADGNLLPGKQDHKIVASYTGDTNFYGSTGTFDQRVLKGVTTVDVSSSANPSVQHQPIHFTATVNTDPSGATGTIQFKIDGSNFGSPVTIDANGQAVSVNTSTLSVAHHNVEAVYSGDDNYAGSTGTLDQNVQAFPTNFNFSIFTANAPWVGNTPPQSDAIYDNRSFTFYLSDTAGIYQGPVRLILDHVNSSPFPNEAFEDRFGTGYIWHGQPTVVFNSANPANCPAQISVTMRGQNGGSYPGQGVFSNLVFWGDEAYFKVENPHNPGVYATLHGSSEGFVTNGPIALVYLQ